MGRYTKLIKHGSTAVVRAAVSGPYVFLLGLYPALLVVAFVAVRLLVGVVIALPTLGFLLARRFRLVPSSRLYRREYVTLVSLDIALSQHFFVVAGYFTTAVLGSVSFGLLLPPSPTQFLLSWTAGPSRSYGSATTAAVFALRVHGAIGVALIVSLVIATYTRVVSQFDRTDDDLEQLTSELDIGDPRRELSESRRTEVVKLMIANSLRDAINRGEFGDPVLPGLWQWVRREESVVEWTRRLLSGLGP